MLPHGENQCVSVNYIIKMIVHGLDLLYMGMSLTLTVIINNIELKNDEAYSLL